MSISFETSPAHFNFTESTNRSNGSVFVEGIMYRDSPTPTMFWTMIELFEKADNNFHIILHRPLNEYV